jgi:NAD(P)-dependent dehydrogenase (short-subunit alcohol dehydrogenase family)
MVLLVILLIFCFMKMLTGTSRGIGFELALKFANAGHQVLHFKKTPKKIIEHENISCLSVDLAVEADVEQ